MTSCDLTGGCAPCRGEDGLLDDPAALMGELHADWRLEGGRLLRRFALRSTLSRSAKPIPRVGIRSLPLLDGAEPRRTTLRKANDGPSYSRGRTHYGLPLAQLLPLPLATKPRFFAFSARLFLLISRGPVH